MAGNPLDGVTGSGFLGGVGDYLGKGLGTSQFNTDPTQFKLGGPGAGWNGAFGAQGQTYNIPGLGPISAGPGWQDILGGAAKQAIGASASGGEFSGQQQQLAQMLMAQAQGGGPNPAQAMLQQNTDRNIAQSYAMAQAMGGNQAASARNVANQAAAARQQGVADASLLRQQQQLAAQGQLGNVLQQGVGNAYNQQQLAQGYLGMGMGAANTQLQANIEQQKIASGAYNSSADRAQKTVGGLASGIGSALGFDEGGEVPGYAFLSGGQVPGRASAPGDSPSNDTVPAKLSPGEVVLPRSVTQAEDAPEKAAAFMEAVSKSKAPKPTFADVLSSHRQMHERLKRLEALYCGGMA